jgi:hypothetical protein
MSRYPRHGHAGTNNHSRTYQSWCGMKKRCYYPPNKDYPNYGGRGIRMIKRWKDSFEEFLKDMGERPDGKTLDRKNPDGDYTPYNCKWSTATEQSRNRKNVHWVYYRGKMITLGELMAGSKIWCETIRFRVLKRGWDAESAATLPADWNKKK